MKNYNSNILTSITTTKSNNISSTSQESETTLTENIVDGKIYKGENSMSQDVNVLALVKGEERYIFLYNDANRAETLRTLGRYASNPELSFTWYDAAVLSQKIRQESQQLAREQQQNEFYTQPRYNNIYSNTAEEIE
ncbi:MAG: hypothetical protein LBC74_00665 [Planctomycetaceae bacterium]|jgi:hypothetical protein|nr:hypothetical protein [Planctomycetaceae bacterium]